MRTELNIAWAAGLFEGEGCITSINGGEGVGLSLSTTDLDVLDRFFKIVNCGGLYQVKKAKSHHKQAWSWHCNKRANVEELMYLFSPYLGKRRTQRYTELKEETELLRSLRLPKPGRNSKGQYIQGRNCDGVSRTDR